MDASLPDIATIQRYVPTSDDQGGQTRAYTTQATVACRLSRATYARETTRGGEPVAVAGFELVLPYGTDLRAQDRAVIAGTTYEVTETDAGTAEAIAVTASVQRVS